MLSFHFTCSHFKYSLQFPHTGNFSFSFTEPTTLALFGIYLPLFINTSTSTMAINLLDRINLLEGQVAFQRIKF